MATPKNPPGPPGDVPPGVQPEKDGELQCLDCGIWSSALGNHVGRAHDSYGEYQKRHKVPSAADLRTDAAVAAAAVELGYADMASLIEGDCCRGR